MFHGIMYLRTKMAEYTILAIQGDFMAVFSEVITLLVGFPIGLANK